MTGLGVYGYECFYELEHSGEFKFEEDTCFYGNVDIKIDFDDRTNNFYEGYFININMLEILTVLMDYDVLVVYEKIHRGILEASVIREGCIISYASKNIVNNEMRVVLIP